MVLCAVLFYTLPKQCFVDVIPVLCCVVSQRYVGEDMTIAIDGSIDVNCYKIVQDIRKETCRLF